MLDTRNKAVQYKKLNLLFDYHRVQLKKFLTRVWVFYDLLDRFHKNPNEEEKGKLETEFDELFFNRNRIRGNTCKKQMVGFFDYIRDTFFSGKRAMTSLAQLIFCYLEKQVRQNYNKLVVFQDRLKL